MGGVLVVILMLVAIWRLSFGEWSLPLSQVMRLLSPFLAASERVTPEALVVRSVRLPRLLSAVGVGGILAASGAVLQGLLCNSLAEPYTLGIAAGAAFGAALSFFFNSMLTTPFAFMGALGALWAVNLIAWRGGGGGSYLILAGIITNAILSAGVTFIKSVADDRLGAIVLWLMGSLSGASWSAVLSVWLAAAVIFFPAWLCGPRLDAVSLGEGRGALLGVDEKRLRLLLLHAASFGAAVAVSRFGIIGFVGLVVPHLVRLGIGPAHRPLLIFCFLGGGALLALADGVAQGMGELPVGVVTALIGGPFFCWLLVRKGPIR